MEPQLKSYRLGFLLLNRMGEDYVSKLFDQQRTEWMIKAPVLEKKADGLGALISFKKDDTVSYLAYGSSMSTQRMLQRLKWDPQSVQLLQQSAEPRRCEVPGYDIAFNKPDNPQQPIYGLANIVKDGTAKMEGVLYRLSPAALEFLDASEDGYHRESVAVKIDGKTVTAHAYVANAPRDGLRPPKNYLQLVLDGAREHKLSDDYVARLAGTPTAPADVDFVADLDLKLSETTAKAATG
jgi:hypothetical protein